MAITKTDFPYELESFSLAHIMDSPILQNKEDVEEVNLLQFFHIDFRNFLYPLFKLIKVGAVDACGCLKVISICCKFWAFITEIEGRLLFYAWYIYCRSMNYHAR